MTSPAVNLLESLDRMVGYVETVQILVLEELALDIINEATINPKAPALQLMEVVMAFIVKGLVVS